MAVHYRTLLLGVVLTAMTLGGMSGRAATYYVSTESNANNSNPGTQASPWRTITYAATRAVAGDTVMIKAGGYGNEHVVVANAGTGESKRITFEGYGGTVKLGILPSPRTAPADTEIGIMIKGKNYITLKNLNLTGYYSCVQVENSDYVICENLYIDKCGSTTWMGFGIRFSFVDYGQILSCTVIDSGGDNVGLEYSNYCLIDNLKALGTLPISDAFCTDYYCVLICCHDCTIQNSLAEDLADSGKGNHGFIIKDLGKTPHSTNNTIIDCRAISFEECFSVAHLAYNNQFIRCHADNSAKTNKFNNLLNCRNGAHDNTFRDCTGLGDNILIGLADYEEGNYQTKTNNKFINCRLRGTNKSTSIGVNFRRTGTNTFQNCVFDQVNYLARYITTSTESNSGNVFNNCIVAGMTASYDTRNLDWFPWGDGLTPYDGASSQTWTYTDFWDNDFSALSGSGNMSADPNFADRANADYHLKSTTGRWNGSTWVNDAENSPLIDKGDPSSIFTNEPNPNGGRVNIGGYGNTAEASKSSSGIIGGKSPYDNRLCERYPTTVYSSNKFLDAGHYTNYDKKYRDLVWFDLSSYKSPVRKATLSLYWYYPTTTRTADTILDIYRPAMGWDHDYVSWNAKSGSSAWTNVGGDWYDKNGTAQGSVPYASITFAAAQTATNTFYNFDVTSLVNEYIASGNNAGFFIKARTELNNYIGFYGFANTDSATFPKLTVEIYSSVPGRAWVVYE